MVPFSRLRRLLRPGAPAPAASSSVAPLPSPPPGARNVVLVVLDSCRFDSFAEAAPPNLLRLGPLERRWSWATWTPPAHHALLMGLLPHPGQPGTWAGDVFRDGYRAWKGRLGLPDLDLSRLLPEIWLPSFLQGLGYHTQALVSLPVLHPATPLNRAFDQYGLMDRHDDAAGVLGRLRFFRDRPSFVLLNLGETHYPYTVPGRSAALPHLHGVHGTLATLHDDLRAGQGVPLGAAPSFFTPARLRDLQDRQVDAVRHLDPILGRLFDLVPSGTHVIVTADHGELFGEGGFFGHGPVTHPAVLEVPFLEGRVG